MDHRGVDHHVVVDEFRGPRAVRHDAAHGSSDEKYELGTVGAKPVIHRCLIAQIELTARGGENILEPFRLETPDDCRPDEALMPRDIDARIKGDITHARRPVFKVSPNPGLT